jgi:hypothetical protein
LLIDRASLESQSATVAIFSILAIGAIFLVDLVDGREIWLHILYVFPIGVLALSCAAITPVVIGVLLMSCVRTSGAWTSLPKSAATNSPL